MNEFFIIIFGQYTLAQLIGFLWFFVIGYVLYGLIEVKGRDIESFKTPEKWSWKFWFLDNWRRYLTTIMCTYILFKFSVEINQRPFENFDAISLGLIGDGLAAMVKKRVKVIGADREKLMAINIADELKSEQKMEANVIVEDNKFIADELKLKQEVTANELIINDKFVADELKSEQKIEANIIVEDNKLIANELKSE